MALSRVKTIEKILAILSDMDKLLVIGKIRSVFVHDEAAILPAVIIREGLQWLIAVQQDAYAGVLNIWKHCKPEVWNRYFLYGCFEEHSEVQLLRKSLKVLKKAMSHRPVLFLKGKSSGIIKRQSRGKESLQ